MDAAHASSFLLASEASTAVKLFSQLYPGYSDTAALDELRKSDFSRLDTSGQVYLDFTGGSLYAIRQVQQHMELLNTSILGNPHSTNPASLLSGQLIEKTRKQIQDYFRANDYQLVFTANASQALKIVGESYPFEDRGQFLLLFDNHNSVNGIREYCRSKGGDYAYSPVQLDDLRIDEKVLQRELAAYPAKKNKLFAFPAQSNVSGVKHDLSWIGKAKESGWDVLLDAAAFVPTNPLDLSVHQPDFVTLSFYKMFGYPTGLGALFIHNRVFNRLHKAWFAGGTVKMVGVSSDAFFLAESFERFEDGTLNYTSIPALQYGLNLITELGMPVIQQRVNLLTEWLIQCMKELKHGNGEPLVQIFGPQNTYKRGGTVIFNLFTSRGQLIPYYLIEQAANREGIALRTGCFCNPGIDEINHTLSREELQNYFTTHSHGDFSDMNESLGKMRGAIRVSLGWVSRFEDVHRLGRFLEQYIE
jgi:molybdenum cofactor sulfurtransferase